MWKIAKKIRCAKRILISSHISPDADAIGSGLALLLAIKGYYPDKMVKFVLDKDVSDYFSCLRHSYMIESLETVSSTEEFDTIILLDTSTFKRMGGVSQFVDSQTELINIDHHADNERYGSLNYINSKVSSTCEIVFHLIKEFDVKINKEIAEYLYYGIVGDTGNFSYSVSSETHKIAGELLELKIKNEKIVKKVFRDPTETQLRLLGFALTNFTYVREKKLSYIYISQAEMAQFPQEENATSLIVSRLLSLKNCNIAACLVESRSGKINGELRSKRKDISKIARMLGGGGHERASGFSTDKTLDEIVHLLYNNL